MVKTLLFQLEIIIQFATNFLKSFNEQSAQNSNKSTFNQPILH